MTERCAASGFSCFWELGSGRLDSDETDGSTAPLGLGLMSGSGVFTENSSAFWEKVVLMAEFRAAPADGEAALGLVGGRSGKFRPSGQRRNICLASGPV